MKKIINIMKIIAICIVAFCLYLLCNDNLGTPKNSIQKRARESQSIPDDWDVSEYTTSGLSAMVFYNEDLSAHIYSIYVNRQGVSFGYFFRHGGIDSSIQNKVREFRIEETAEKMTKHTVSVIQKYNLLL